MVDVSASLLLDLDTAGPVLTITPPTSISPPSDGLVLFAASEPVGAAAAYLTDALGDVQTLGVEQVDALRYAVLVPGQDLVRGPARLDLVVNDLVGNRTRRVVDLFVQGDTDLRVDVGARPSMLLQISTRSSFDLIPEARPSVLLEVRNAGG